MEIEFKDVIERIGKKVGQLQVDNEILTLQIEALQAKISELEGPSANGRHQDVVDAEVVKD